jgi:hypothetical protein
MSNARILPSWTAELLRRLKADEPLLTAARGAGVTVAAVDQQLRANPAFKAAWIDALHGGKLASYQAKPAAPGRTSRGAQLGRAQHGIPGGRTREHGAALVPPDELLRYEGMTMAEWQRLTPARQVAIMQSYLPAQQQRSAPAPALRSDGHLTRAERLARQQHQIRVGRSKAQGAAVVEAQQRQQGTAVRKELAELRERLKNKKERDKQRLY